MKNTSMLFIYDYHKNRKYFSHFATHRFQNAESAIRLAHEHLGIPMVLTPENLSSHDLDELSGMTYLSYFMKEESPGYYATLNWVRQQISPRPVNNFDVSIWSS